MAKLTAKQERFVEEYLVDLNATQAAIRAGYSPDTAKDIGCENLAKPNVRTHIDKAMAELSRRTGVNQERVIRELARVAFVNSKDVVSLTDATVLEDATQDDTAAIASVKVKIRQSQFLCSVRGNRKEAWFLLGGRLDEVYRVLPRSVGQPWKVKSQDCTHDATLSDCRKGD